MVAFCFRKPAGFPFSGWRRIDKVKRTNALPRGSEATCFGQTVDRQE